MESRIIMLKTIDILASNNANDYFNTVVSNAKGIIENNRYSFTWHINLRETLGNDFYNKFNRFSVESKSYGDCPFSTTVIDPLDISMQYWTRISHFYLSGLNLQNKYARNLTTNLSDFMIETQILMCRNISD